MEDGGYGGRRTEETEDREVREVAGALSVCHASRAR